MTPVFDSALASFDDFDLAETRVRKDLYVLTAALLASPPSAEVVDALCNPDLLNALEALQFSAAAESLRLHASDRSEAQAACDRSEYFGLFAVPTSRYLAPFEAVSCDEREIDGQVVRGLLMGASTRAVERVYERSGFTLAVPELPDHVCCEVAFIAELCKREVISMEAGDRSERDRWRAARREFVRAHAGRWVPGMCRRLAETTTSHLYRGLAHLLLALLEGEPAALST